MKLNAQFEELTLTDKARRFQHLFSPLPVPRLMSCSYVYSNYSQSSSAVGSEFCIRQLNTSEDFILRCIDMLIIVIVHY